MKKLNTFLILISGLTSNYTFSQIDYFGQESPGDSAVIFAPGIVSQNNRNERCLTISPYGDETFFQVIYGNWESSETKYYVLNDDQWQEQPLPESLDGFVLGEPAFSPDGNRVYFSYNPYSGQWQNELYYIEKNDTTWSIPVKLPSNVNFAKGLWHPSVTNNGNLYFAYTGKIYLCEKNDTGYNNAMVLPKTINTGGSYGVWDAYVDPEERFMVFKSDRSGGYGEQDIYISFKKNEQWTNMKNLGPIVNTINAEDASDITPDGKYLTFSKIVNGEKDIYWMSFIGLLDSLMNSNFSPYVKYYIPDHTDTLGNYFSYTIPDSIFFDDDGNETLTLTAELSDGSDLPDSLSFNPSTNTISGKLMHAEIYNIKVTATDTAGASISDDFKLTVINSTNVSENRSEPDYLLVYPNPADHTILIRTKGSTAIILNYRILDMIGKVIKQDKYVSDSIDVSDMNKGIYMLQLQTDKKTIVQKIVIE